MTTMSALQWRIDHMLPDEDGPGLDEYIERYGITDLLSPEAVEDVLLEAYGDGNKYLVGLLEKAFERYVDDAKNDAALARAGL